MADELTEIFEYKKTEYSVNREGLKNEVYVKSTEGLQRIYAEVLHHIEALSGLIRAQLDPSKRQTVNSLIIQRVHSRDCIRKYIYSTIDKQRDFLWQI